MADRSAEIHTVGDVSDLFVLTEGPRDAESFAMALRELREEGFTGYPALPLQQFPTQSEAALAYATYHRAGDPEAKVDPSRLHSAQRSSSIVWSVGFEGVPGDSPREMVEVLLDRAQAIYRDRSLRGMVTRGLFRAVAGLRSYELEASGNWVGVHLRQPRKQSRRTEES